MITIRISIITPATHGDYSVAYYPLASEAPSAVAAAEAGVTLQAVAGPFLAFDLVVAALAKFPRTALAVPWAVVVVVPWAAAP